MSKAEKYEVVSRENDALKVRLTNLEDTLGVRNAGITECNRSNTELKSEIKSLKTYRLILAIIAAIAIGVLVWRIFGR